MTQGKSSIPLTNGADMEWVSFVSGAVIVGFAYALFSDEYIDEEIEEEGNTIYTGRSVVMSCQTCRKLKRHREIEPSLYQCPKCKREVDLR